MKTDKKINLIIALLFSFAFFSCKESGPEPDEPKDKSGQFLNLNVGSNWEYSTDSAINTTIVKVVDSTKIMNSKTYKIFHSTYQGALTRNFYSYKNGNYYLLVESTTGNYEELVYLKDSNEVGKKWSQTLNLGELIQCITTRFPKMALLKLFTARLIQMLFI